MDEFAPLTLLTLLTLAGGWAIYAAFQRTNADVLEDLSDEDGVDGGSGSRKINLTDSLAKAGLLTADERRRFRLLAPLYPWGGAAVAVLLSLLLFSGSGTKSFVCAAAGLLAGFAFERGRIRRAEQRYLRALEFFLPIVMERLVMAVQSGLDVLAAITVIATQEPETTEPLDPVTRLLDVVKSITERGVLFDAALREVADGISSCAVRHAFVHLAVAYREGGELVMPLKELSDATQLQYQESMDEEIAKLPVKATMPLLCTFGGLILCFITPPLIQLAKLAGTATRGM